jgi:hypothetical protein
MEMLGGLDQYKSGLQITNTTCYETCIYCQCGSICLETNIFVHPVLYTKHSRVQFMISTNVLS